MLSQPIPNCRVCPLSATGAGRCPFTPTQLPASAVVVNQGEAHPTVYFIREGTVALCTVDADGAERGLAIRGPRSLLCFESLSGSPSPYEVRAISALRLCSMPARALGRWVGPDRSPAASIIELLLTELSRRQEDMSWRRGDSMSRVSRFVLAAGMKVDGARPLQKQLVARVLGMRPETLSRCLGKLAERGLIARGGTAKVVDPSGLAAVGAGE
ncbi:MAG: Crp/Fnr family transcriptional regulator [Myxococcaceae bacterium]